jgi:integrase
VVVPIRDGQPAAACLITEFARRYGNPKTRSQYVAELTDLFRTARRDHPRLLTEADVLSWAGQRHLANNTQRNRLSRVCTFLRWCVRTGEADPALVEALMSRDNPLRRVPRLYGKVQGKNPARWLTHDEAFGTLLRSCRDGSAIGTRDELLLRLGLAGLRAAEIIRLRVRDLHLDDSPPTIAWIGKANRARRIVPGTQLLELLARYLDDYAENIGRELRPTDPVICREKPGGGTGQLSWGNPISQICSVQRIVRLRADAANLGHLSPHDLRRSAAGILHRATDEHGAHHFDLLDIQKVLDHADPATTMRSYLDPMDTTVKERAASYLD